MPPLSGGYIIIVRKNYMCEFILGVLIVGAIEIEPGWMTVDYINKEDLGILDRPVTVERIYVPTQTYLGCYE